MRRKPPDVPMRCAVCNECVRTRDWRGQLTNRCVFGGPFRGYATQPQEKEHA